MSDKIVPSSSDTPLSLRCVLWNHVITISYTVLFVALIIVVEILVIHDIGVVRYQDITASGHDAHLLAVGVAGTLFLGSLMFWRRKFLLAAPPRQQVAVVGGTVVATMLFIYHIRRSYGYFMVGLRPEQVEEPPMRHVTWICTHVIILQAICVTCNATPYTNFALHSMVWLSKLFGLRVYAILTTNIVYGLLAGTCLAEVVMCGLLLHLRARTLKCTGSSSRDMTAERQCAKYLIPAYIGVSIPYTTAWIAYGTGKISLSSIANMSSVADILLLGIIVSQMSDVMWSTHAHAEQLVRKQAQDVAAAKSAQAAQRAFLRYICHELRVPLNGALLAAEDLAEEIQSPGEGKSVPKEDIDTVVTSLDAMSKLLDDFLCYAKIEAGAFTLLPEPFCPRAMVSNTVQLFHQAFESKRVQLDVNLASDIPETMIGDELRLAQIIRNFLSNALKFTPEGGKVTVTACLTDAATDLPPNTDTTASSTTGSPNSTQPVPTDLLKVNTEAPDTRFLEVRVSDTGIGISREDQARLFKAFTQINAGAAQKGNGTGLGLSICKQIVEASGGKIGCMSKVNEGSTFYFCVPCATNCFTPSDCSAREMVTVHSEQLHPWESGSPVSRMNSQLRPRKCLQHVAVVDDVASNRRPLVRYLKRIGVADVHEAENGALALAQKDWLQNDLWLVDRNMPVMDGVTLVQKLRARGCRSVIVGLTGDALAEDQTVFVDAGLDALLTKPCNHRTLCDKLEQLGFNMRSMSTPQQDGGVYSPCYV